MVSHRKNFTFVFCSAFLVLLVSGFSRNLPIVSFDEGYSHLFGDGNLMVLKDGKSAHISLDDRTGACYFGCSVHEDVISGAWILAFNRKDWIFNGWIVCAGSGFVSQELYLHGYFSASIKLPADYTAGVVVAFYVSGNLWGNELYFDLFLFCGIWISWSYIYPWILALSLSQILFNLKSIKFHWISCMVGTRKSPIYKRLGINEWLFI